MLGYILNDQICRCLDGCVVFSMIERRTSEELRKLVGVQPIATVIRRDRLRWMVWTCNIGPGLNYRICGNN